MKNMTNLSGRWVITIPAHFQNCTCEFHELPEHSAFCGSVLDLHGKILVLEGVTGMAPLRHFQKLPPCLRELIPAISKMDLRLAKAKPINSGSAIRYLRRKNSYYAGGTAAREEWSENL